MSMNTIDVQLLLDNLEMQAVRDKLDATAVGAAIFNGNGEILLVQRSQSDDFLPGLFELPGGGVNTGETLGEALRREIQEETGFAIKSIVAYVGHFDYQHASGEKKRQFNFIVQGTFSADKVQLSEEHAVAKWITKNAIEHYTITPEMKTFIENAFAIDLLKSTK